VGEDSKGLEEALEIIEALCQQKRFQAMLTGEEYIRVLCETCRNYLHLPSVLVKGFSTLTTLAAASVSASAACMKYSLHEIFVQAFQQHLSAVKASEVKQMASSTAFAALGKKQLLARSASTLISQASEPVHLCYVAVALLLAIMGHENEEINRTLCNAATDTLLAILKVFALDSLFVSRMLKLLGKFSLDDPCIAIMIHRKCVDVVVGVARQHLESHSLVLSVVEFFSNLASLEEVSGPMTSE
jgi:hypothetical protein